jgi:hypothetical protein
MQFHSLGSNVYMSSVLDYSIRGLLAPFISPVFYGCISRGGSMVSEPRSCVQFLLVTQFSARPVGTAAPEREQAAPIATACM